MDILNTVSLESNSQIKINFDGGDLSSDAGLLLFKEFLFKIGAVKLVNRMFKANDTAWFRIHKDDANLMQVIYQIISSYFEDDCADELTNEPVMTAILEKEALASQPTLSRFFNRMDEDTLSQLHQIIRELREADLFMKSLLEEFADDFPDMPLYLRGDSGFASPDLYEVLEDKNCKYAIRLKENARLRELAEEENQALYRATRSNQVDYAVEYGEFLYQAGSWSHPRRVVFKIEKPYGQMIHLYTFIVTTLEMEPYQVIQFYCGRGKMENFIKEGKSGFDFASVSSSSKLVNANRLLVHALAYNLFNWFRRLALAVSMRKQRIDTIRLKLLKIAARVVRSARYKYFKLCSSCPYKKEFYETLENIHNLKPQLE